MLARTNSQVKPGEDETGELIQFRSSRREVDTHFGRFEGSKIGMRAGANFCPSCGAPVEKNSTTQPQPETRTTRTRPRGFAASYAFPLLGALATLAGGFFLSYQVGGLVARAYDTSDGRALMGIGLVAAGIAICGIC